MTRPKGLIHLPFGAPTATYRPFAFSTRPAVLVVRDGFHRILRRGGVPLFAVIVRQSSRQAPRSSGSRMAGNYSNANPKPNRWSSSNATFIIEKWLVTPKRGRALLHGFVWPVGVHGDSLAALRSVPIHISPTAHSNLFLGRWRRALVAWKSKRSFSGDIYASTWVQVG